MLTYDSDTLLHIRAHQRTRWLLACFMTIAATSCSASQQLAPKSGYSSQLGAQHPLVGQVYSGQTHERVGPDALQQAIGRARYLILGETHDNRDHHQLQAELLQQFLHAQPGAAVAFEMLDEDDRVALSQEPPIQSPSELAQRVDWPNSGWPEFAIYQPVFETALSLHARIVAAHPSGEHVRASMAGVEEAEARDLHIDTPLPEAQVQAQHAEIRDSHCGHANEQMLIAMQRAQVYKDAFMARALVNTHTPTALIAGRGHARSDRAVPYFLKQSAAGTTLSIAFIEVDDNQLEPAAYDSEAFDYIVFTPRVSDEDPCEKFRKQLEQMRQHPRGARNSPRDKPMSALNPQLRGTPDEANNLDDARRETG